MRALWVVLSLAAGLGWWASAEAVTPTPGECAGRGGAGPSRCLYRSLAPSAGLVADCRNDADCRVGYYYGDPDHPVWLTPPPDTTTLPKPEVIWRAATLAEVRFGCGAFCTFSYFFEVRRRRLSPPRSFVLDVDPRRVLLAAAEDGALVVRQIFSGREVARIERPWAPAPRLIEVVSAIAFEADGRLAFTWLRGPDRTPVHERISVPSVPMPNR
jgi:hypothetical protein